jgi:hypothetical protein
MAAHSENTELFRKLRLAEPVAADYNRDYRALEVINIKELTNWGQ